MWHRAGTIQGAAEGCYGALVSLVLTCDSSTHSIVEPWRLEKPPLTPEPNPAAPLHL